MEGEEVIECVFDEVFELSDVIIVKRNWKYGLFSKATKREIVECVFDSISTTSNENLLLVNKDKLSGYINKNGDQYWED
jgi:hypothetical protein